MNIESGTTYSQMSMHLCFSKCGDNLFPFSNLIVCVSVVVWGGGVEGGGSVLFNIQTIPC